MSDLNNLHWDEASLAHSCEQSSVAFCDIVENNKKDKCCTIEATILNGLLDDKVRVLVRDEVKALWKMSTMLILYIIS